MKGLIAPVSPISLPLPIGVVITLISSITDGEFELSVTDGKFTFSGEKIQEFLGEFLTLLDPFSVADWWRWAGYPANEGFNSFLWETAIEEVLQQNIPLGDWAIWSEIEDLHSQHPDWGINLSPVEGAEKLA